MMIVMPIIDELSGALVKRIISEYYVTNKNILQVPMHVAGNYCSVQLTLHLQSVVSANLSLV